MKMPYIDKPANPMYNKTHINCIKKKLLEGKSNFMKKHNLDTLSDYEICKRLNSDSKFACTIPTITKRLTPSFNTDLNDEASSINITLVVKLCKLFEIDLNYVLALPEDNTQIPDPIYFGIKAQQLEDEGYMGDFHCYRLTATSASADISFSEAKDTLQTNNHISHSTLEIKPHNNHVIAKMITQNKTTLVDGSERIRYSTLTGEPILYTKTNNILLNLQSEEGEFYTMLFDYQPFDSGPMYYREAIILLSTKGTRYLPLLSKAIITRNEIPERYHDYLSGLLALNTNTIIISKEKVDELINKDSDIATFFDDFNQYKNIWARNFYVIPENIAQNINHHTKLSQLELQKIFLKLRNNSYSKSQVIVGDAYKASVIGKEIQGYVYNVTENVFPDN